MRVQSQTDKKKTVADSGEWSGWSGRGLGARGWGLGARGWGLRAGGTMGRGPGTMGRGAKGRSEAADVGEALELLREVVLVEHGVGAVLHHLQGHCAEHRGKLVDALRPAGRKAQHRHFCLIRINRLRPSQGPRAPHCHV